LTHEPIDAVDRNSYELAYAQLVRILLLESLPFAWSILSMALMTVHSVGAGSSLLTTAFASSPP